jgi:ketol-acid reductoisomerase
MRRPPPYTSSIFSLDTLALSSGNEQFLRGGRREFANLPAALAGINEWAFIGFGPQAAAQAPNLRDAIKEAGSGPKVSIGLKAGSESFAKAREAGFSEEEGTLGEMFDVISRADAVSLLISDGAQTRLIRKVMKAMKSGATLVLSHAFLYAYLKANKKSFRKDINVILMAPKGMGDSLRRLFLQGADIEGAGINSSVAVQQDYTGKALDYALALAVGTGSPVTFFTTMINEVRSDLTGERAILLAAVWAAVEAVYEHYTGACGMGPEQAFLASTKGLTSTVAELISQHGLRGLYQQMTDTQRDKFVVGYNAGYASALPIIKNIYAAVKDGSEIKEVVRKTKELEHEPMQTLDLESMPMWQVGAKLYGEKVEMNEALALTAGLYVGIAMAQVIVLRENGHSVSEIANETIIEAIDSLLPFMNARGIAFMVEKCSITARLGTRKWGPVFKDAFAAALASPAEDYGDQAFKAFLGDPFHDDLAQCYRLRPTVKIAVELAAVTS